MLGATGTFINHILDIILTPKRMPERMGRKRVGTPKLFQGYDLAISLDATAQGEPEVLEVSPGSQPCQRRQRGQLVRSPVHQKKEFRIVAKLHRRVKSAIPKRGGHHCHVHRKTYKECLLFEPC